MVQNKLFRFREECCIYIIAPDKDRAIDWYIGRCVGHKVFGIEVEAYLKDGMSYDEFIEVFVHEVPMDEMFTLYVMDDGEPLELTVRDHIAAAEKDYGDEFPRFFAQSED